MLEEINLERIKRIIMNNSTGTRNFLRGSHTDLTDLTDFLNARERNDEMKRLFRQEWFLKEGIFRGKTDEFLCKEMNIYAKQGKEMNKYPKQRL